MASDADKKELKTKVKKLVKQRFSGSYEKAFAHYANLISKKGKTPSVDRRELIRLLKDADVGYYTTRGMWADGIIDEVDSNRDRKITWREFERGVINSKAG